jgi:hypothetical protein
MLSLGMPMLALGLVWYTWPDQSDDLGVGSTATTPREVLERAALQRFATTTPQIRLPDGRQKPITNPEQAKAIKVIHFKELLKREELMRNSAFAEEADMHLREGKPALIVVEWESEAGTERVEKVVSDTVTCGLDRIDEPRPYLFEDLKRLDCLYEEASPFWDTVATTVTISREPIVEGDFDWNRLREETMRDLAAIAFVQRSLQNLARRSSK